jgi:zinc/manganese transport system permease protein
VTFPFSWNLVNDIRDMWSLPFMLNAYRAGSVVAVLAGLVGWFMVLRRQSFAGHTLALVGFPGAAAAVWLGVGASAGYFGFCLAAAVVIAALPGAGLTRNDESAVIGTVQSFALATGMLFLALYRGFFSSTNALLFGSFLGVTRAQVLVLGAVATLVLLVLAAIGRPLLFASVDRQVAHAHGVPGGVLNLVFLLLLGAAAAEVSQITGALLVFALLVLPPAAAQLLTARPARGLLLSVLLALVTVWLALFVSFYSPYPIGFWLTSIGFAGYLAAAAWSAVAARTRRRPARVRTGWAGGVPHGRAA